MFCSNCGKEIPEGAAFCPECGAKVGGGSAAPKINLPSNLNFGGVLENLKNPSNGKLGKTESIITLSAFGVMQIFVILQMFRAAANAAGADQYLGYVGGIEHKVGLVIVYGILYAAMVAAALLFVHSNKNKVAYLSEVALTETAKSLIVPLCGSILFVLFSFFFGIGSFIVLLFCDYYIIYEVATNISFKNKYLNVLVVLVMALIITLECYFGINSLNFGYYGNVFSGLLDDIGGELFRYMW